MALINKSTVEHGLTDHGLTDNTGQPTLCARSRRFSYLSNAFYHGLTDNLTRFNRQHGSTDIFFSVPRAFLHGLTDMNKIIDQSKFYAYQNRKNSMFNNTLF